MSANPAFSSRSDCPLPYIPDIEPDLIQDCEIPPVPDPFFETPLFPPIIPPITVGCPPISASADVWKVQNPSFSPKFSVFTSTYDPDGDECFPYLDLDIWIPFACPSFSVKSPSPSVSTSPSYSLKITKKKDNAPDCEFEFDLDITFVCTSLSISISNSKISWDSDPSLSISQSLNMSDNKCELELDFKLEVPGFDDVDRDCDENDWLIVGGDLYVEDNILYFSCSRVPFWTNTEYYGAGDCINTIDLDYRGYGSFVLEVVRKSCECTYC